MNTKNYIEFLLLSCDKYSDLWEDFFNVKEKFWPNCPYTWHVVTESKEYHRDNVDTIKCGSDKNWAGRFRYAVNTVQSDYLGVFLDDYLIESSIDNNLISEIVKFAEDKQVDFINMTNDQGHIIRLENKEYFAEHFIKIPKHLKYGVDTAASIWKKDYLLSRLGDADYSAWQFELNSCAEAKSHNGLQGLILCDDRMPFNVTKIPFVIQGKVYTPCVDYFHKKGYEIITQRERMSMCEVKKFKATTLLSRIKFGRKVIKWIATHVFGYTFFTSD